MKRIRIIHTNDVHSSFDKFVKIATIIKKLQEEQYMLLDAGDFNDFSSYVTYGTKGHAGLNILNSLGYLALAIGNNEGFQSLDILEDNCQSNLVNILSCNVFKLNGDNIKGLKTSIIKEIDGIRFLIIGVSPYLKSYNDYYNNYDIKAVEPFNLIRKEIKENKEKYDFVILLSHLGLKTDIMVSQSILDVDIIISGHSHHVMDCVKVNNSYIHQSGVRGSHAGYLDLFIENNKIIDVIDKNIAIDDSVSDDITTKDLLERMSNIAINNLNRYVANIPIDLKYSIDKECKLTNLLADYLKNNYKCDFALINSGLTESNLYKGNITMNDVLKVCNSPLFVSIMKVKGSIIIKALKQSLNKDKCYEDYRRPGFRGKFLGKLHVSYNCRIDKNAQNVYIDGELIDKNKLYSIVSSDYFLRGMGYEMLKDNREGKMCKQSIQNAIIAALNDKDSYKFIDVLRWEE